MQEQRHTQKERQRDTHIRRQRKRERERERKKDTAREKRQREQASESDHCCVQEARSPSAQAASPSKFSAPSLDATAPECASSCLPSALPLHLPLWLPPSHSHYHFLHFACCYDEIRGTQDFKICSSPADSLHDSLSLLLSLTCRFSDSLSGWLVHCLAFLRELTEPTVSITSTDGPVADTADAEVAVAERAATAIHALIAAAEVSQAAVPAPAPEAAGTQGVSLCLCLPLSV